MIQVQDTGSKLVVIGHAANGQENVSDVTRNVCVSVTALIKSLISGMTVLCGDNPAYIMKPGKFILDKEKLNGHSLFLIQAFMCGIYDLAAEYSSNLKIYDDSGHEVRSDESSWVQDYPDWKNFLVCRPSGPVSGKEDEICQVLGKWLD